MALRPVTASNCCRSCTPLDDAAPPFQDHGVGLLAGDFPEALLLEPFEPCGHDGAFFLAEFPLREGLTMAKLYTLTFLVLFGSAAAADDRVQTAAEKHFRCTSEAAQWLAMMDGTPEALAERALSRCRAEERNLRRVLDANGVKALRVIAKAANT